MLDPHGEFIVLMVPDAVFPAISIPLTVSSSMLGASTIASSHWKHKSVGGVTFFALTAKSLYVNNAHHGNISALISANAAAPYLGSGRFCADWSL